MDDQEPHKSPKNIFDLIKKGINKIIQEKNKKSQLKHNIIQLDELLIEMTENVRKMANLTEIEKSRTVIYLYFNDNDLKLKYRIATSIYNKDNVILCYSDSKDSPYKIKCVNFGDIESEPFKLFYLPKSISFIGDIENLILNIYYNILNPRACTHIDKQYMLIITEFYTDSSMPIKKNPKISIYSNKLKYNYRRSNITMACGPYDPSKLQLF